MEAETNQASAPPAVVGRRQSVIGVVTSAKMQKTIIVRVTRTVEHGLYRRVLHKAKKYYAHDEKQQARPGDRVRIVATRPLSRLKRWRLVEVIGRARGWQGE
ncbi:MAG TPA: 30S ribosomal protein S17 [Candidatus Dormibacteraeota bacterium]|nr:30S ribosomal protein S17 [Candidatus Dormibacteraeota bacterium]